MMSGQNSSRQVIEAILAGLAQVSLSVPLAIVMTVADHASVTAVEADNTVRPAELTNDFIARPGAATKGGDPEVVRI